MSAGASHRVVTLAGHVDHGKSSLLRALTGMEPDRLDEEQRRGRTIELGFVWTTLPPSAPGADGTTVAFVDVPGHARLVGTMIAGSGVSPAALLVVAADDGPAVQTREHLEVLDLLAVPGLAVALTKTDRVPAERVEAATDEVRAALAGTSFADAPLVPIAGADPAGLDLLRVVLRDRLAATPAPTAEARARLWVDRAFAVGGAGTVVTGTLADGPLAVGDDVAVLPAGTAGRVRRLQQLGRDVDVAAPGTRVAVNLAGIAPTGVARGDVLCIGPDRSTDVVDVLVRVLPGCRVTARGAYRAHVGTAVRTPRVLPLTGALDGDGDRDRDRDGESDGAAVGAVRLLLDRPLPLRLGDRVVLRDSGRGGTVAGGVVIDPEPPRSRAGRAARRAVLAGLAAGGAVAVPDPVATWVELGGGARPMAAGEAWSGAVPGPGGMPESLPGGQGLERLGGLLVTADRSAAWDAVVTGAAAEGLRRGAALARLESAGAVAGAAAAVLDRAIAAGTVDAAGDVLAPGGTGGAAAVDRRARGEALVARLMAEPFAPPDLVPTAVALGIDHPERQALVDAGLIVRCGDVAFAGAAVARALEVLGGLQVARGAFTASEARAALGTTRRFAIPLLEHLVRTGRSRFDGTRHRLVPTGAGTDPGPGSGPG